MVLGAFMNKWRLFLLLILTSMTACANSPSHKIANKAFHLANNSGVCQLVIPSEGAALNLQISWPCQFHENKNGELRVHENLGKKYFLVESSISHPELPGDCITQLQSIVVEGGAFRQSEYKDTVASCPPFAWDTKVFTGLFLNN